MINDKEQKSINKAMISLCQFLDKLEKDGYINNLDESGNKIQVPFYILAMNELFAYLCCRNDTDYTSEQLNKIFDHQIFYDRIFEKFLNDQAEKKGKIPEGFCIICNFDYMAGLYEGAFYSRMKVQYPGKISRYYIELTESLCKCLEIKQDKTDEIITLLNQYVQSQNP